MGSLRSGLGTALLAFGLLLLVVAIAPRTPTSPAPTFSDFLTHVERGDVRTVVLRTRDNSMRVQTERGLTYEIGYPPDYANELLAELRAADASVDVEPAGQRWWGVALRILLPVALLAGLWIFVLRRPTGSGSLGQIWTRASQARCP